MKRDILQQANYRFNFDRALWVNNEAKKAFSLEFLDDHPEEELVRRIEERTAGKGWKFYFNIEPSTGVRRVLESMLG